MYFENVDTSDGCTVAQIIHKIFSLLITSSVVLFFDIVFVYALITNIHHSDRRVILFFASFCIIMLLITKGFVNEEIQKIRDYIMHKNTDVYSGIITNEELKDETYKRCNPERMSIADIKYCNHLAEKLNNNSNDTNNRE